VIDELCVLCNDDGALQWIEFVRSPPSLIERRAGLVLSQAQARILTARGGIVLDPVQICARTEL